MAGIGGFDNNNYLRNNTNKVNINKNINVNKNTSAKNNAPLELNNKVNTDGFVKNANLAELKEIEMTLDNIDTKELGVTKCSATTAGGIFARIFRIGLSLLGWITNPLGKAIATAISIAREIIDRLIK